MNVKKFMARAAGVAAGAALIASMAVPAFAAYCDASANGCAQAAGAGAQCDTGAGSGAFGFFGAQGNVDNVHDVDGTGLGYDQSSDGTDDNVGQGAEGGVTGGTGDRNSSVCGDPQNSF